VSGAWVVVPVKDFAHGKSRLGPVLDLARREELARALFEHVLAVLDRCEQVSGVLVATDSADVEALALARGARVLRDAGPARLRTIVDRALERLQEQGARAALVLMADLPLLAPADVHGLLAALDVAPVVLAPDRRDEGTNALALAPPRRIATCFGSETSFAEHRARANAEGASIEVYRSEGTASDLDTPDDLPLVGYAEPGARFKWNRNLSSRVSAA
jgi:2-phospho-L-lactate guanylyltransferase